MVDTTLPFVKFVLINLNLKDLFSVSWQFSIETYLYFSAVPSTAVLPRTNLASCSTNVVPAVT